MLVICGALKWIDGDPGITGYNVPAKFLVDVEVQQEGLSIGALLVVAAIAGAAGALVPRLRLLTIGAGVAALVVAALHWYQLGEFADLVNEDAFGTGDVSRSDLIGFGVWVGAVAGLGLVVGGVLAGRRSAPQ